MSKRSTASKPKPNTASARFSKVLDEISEQVSALKKFDLHFISVPALPKLARFKAWKVLPKDFIDELNNLLKKPKHVVLLKKLGITGKSELLKQEWLHRFFRWEVKTGAESIAGQKRSLGGVLFEKRILSDPDLDRNLTESARTQLSLTRDFRKGQPLQFDDGPVALSDLAVKRATDFVDLNGRAFLDFGYLFVNKNGAGPKVMPGIEGQIKSRGVVEKYYRGQGDRDTERFPNGFSCMIDGQRRTFGPKDIFLDETFESGAGKALIHPEAKVPATDYQLLNTEDGKFTIDITYKASTRDIEEFINDLYQAKRNALSRTREKP